MRQSSHQHAKQIREGAQYRRQLATDRGPLGKAPRSLPPGSGQKKLLPQRPLLPRHGRQSSDLIDRPGPDEFDEAEDRRNPVMQKFQELIENLFHDQVPRAPDESAKGSVGFPESGPR